MNEEIKFDLDKDIIMQIEMDSYMKYNDTIASMNDHLGEIYGYSDVKDMEEAQLKYEKKLAYKAIKDLQEKAEQEVDRLNNIINELEKYMIKEQARIVINNTNEDEFVYTDLLIKLKELKDSD